MSKKLRNVALLGGATLLASKMLGNRKETPKSETRKESKEDRERDARESAISGALRSIASDEKDTAPKVKAAPKTTSTSTPGISAEEGRSAMGLSREARGRSSSVMEGESASGLPREARGVGVAEGMTGSGLPREARGVRRGDVPGSEVFAQINADRIARQRRAAEEERFMSGRMKSGGTVKMQAGGKVSSASKRADGIASKGKTRCKIV